MSSLSDIRDLEAEPRFLKSVSMVRARFYPCMTVEVESLRYRTSGDVDMHNLSSGTELKRGGGWINASSIVAGRRNEGLRAAVIDLSSV